MYLPLTGQTMRTTSIDHVLNLSTDGGFRFEIEGDVHVRTRSEHMTFAPSPSLDIADDIQKMLTGRITASSVEKGTVRVTLDSGTVLEVRPHSTYEAWTLFGPDGFRMVCMPGGDVATWPAVQDDS